MLAGKIGALALVDVLGCLRVAVAAYATPGSTTQQSSRSSSAYATPGSVVSTNRDTCGRRECIHGSLGSVGYPRCPYRLAA